MANGQLLPINQNQALFSLLGTAYGGDGRTNFALPDLRGRAPVHMGSGFAWGQNGGEESLALTSAQMPAHMHAIAASAAAGTTAALAGNVLASASNLYGPSPAAAPVTLNAATVGSVGGGTAHENRQPFAVLNICISLQGIFPSRN